MSHALLKTIASAVGIGPARVNGGSWKGVLCVLVLLLASLVAPVRSEAQAGIDVPMRRDPGSTVLPTLDSAGAGAVLQIAETILQEIEVLRKELGVDDFPAEPDTYEDRAPVHVFVKSLEVMTKVANVQRRFGVPTELGVDFPLAEPTPDDVLPAVSQILEGLRAIKAQMVIETQVEPPRASGAQTLSIAYKSLADASRRLDGLIGRALTLDDVFERASVVVEDVRQVSEKLDVDLDVELRAVDGAKRPHHVAQQALRAAHRLVALQTDLGMRPSAVPSFAMVRVTPSEIYDLIGLLRAEVMRIKWHLGADFTPPDESLDEPARKTATDVFAQVLLILDCVDGLAAAIDN